MTINERLFQKLEEKNLKKSDLAKHLNVTNSVITSWKTRGTNPPSELLIRICEFLNISIFELLGEKQNYTIEEQELINAYTKADEGTKASVRKLLDIPDRQKTESSTSKIG